MTTIPDVMRSVTDVLGTAEDLLDEGDSDREVAVMLASFLKTLLVDLNETLAAQGHLGQLNHRGNVIGKGGEDLYLEKRPSQRKHADCARSKCLAGTPSECPHYGPVVTGPKVKMTKKPVVNKFPGNCAKCGCKVDGGEGFVLPDVDQNAKKKWHTFCPTHHKEIT